MRRESHVAPTVSPSRLDARSIRLPSLLSSRHREMLFLLHGRTRMQGSLLRVAQQPWGRHLLHEFERDLNRLPSVRPRLERHRPLHVRGRRQTSVRFRQAPAQSAEMALTRSLRIVGEPAPITGASPCGLAWRGREARAGLKARCRCTRLECKTKKLSAICPFTRSHWRSGEIDRTIARAISVGDIG